MTLPLQLPLPPSTIFKGTRGTRTPKYLIIGEAYGYSEYREGRPFVGESGKDLSKILLESGIDESECLFTNVVNEQPFGNKMWKFFYPTQIARQDKRPLVRGLYPMPNVIAGVDKLETLIHYIKPSLKAIIGLGNYSLWALTESSFFIEDDNKRKVPGGITAYRGSQLHDRFANLPFLPTFHPAAALRVYSQRFSIKHDLSTRLNLSWKPPIQEFITSPSFETVMLVLDEIEYKAKEKKRENKEFKLSVDIETKVGLIDCIGLAWTKYNAICIPFVCENKKEGYWPHNQWEIIHFRLRQILPLCSIIGQNFAYDAQYIILWMQLLLNVTYDTMIMHQVCWPSAPHNLNYISSMHCRHHKYWKDEGKESNPNYTEEMRWAYNCKDTTATYEAQEDLAKLLKYLNLESQYDEQRQVLEMILEMTVRGVRVDRVKRREVAKELGAAAHKYVELLENIIPQDVFPRKKKPTKPWYRSPKQQQEIVYDVLGIKPVLHPKTKARTMNDSAIETLIKREPILKAILLPIQEYRSISKFAEFTEQKLDSDDRMRCEYTPTADTFRWKSRANVFGGGGNLANLPKGSERD